jgi:hypothetical protein
MTVACIFFSILSCVDVMGDLVMLCSLLCVQTDPAMEAHIKTNTDDQYAG